MSGLAKRQPTLAPAPTAGLSEGRRIYAGGEQVTSGGGGEEEELSTSSSEGEAGLGTRSTTPNMDGGLYAELDNREDEEEEEEDTMGADTGGKDEDDEMIADRDELIRSRIAASQEQMRSILGVLTPLQLQRYETFRRIGFPRPAIKKIMQRVLDGLAVGRDKPAVTIHPSTVIMVAGIAKVFVGELVEEARAISEEWQETPPSHSPFPLTPAHILEAQRRLKHRGALPTSPNYRKRSRIL